MNKTPHSANIGLQSTNYPLVIPNRDNGTTKLFMSTIHKLSFIYTEQRQQDQFKTANLFMVLRTDC